MAYLKKACIFILILILNSVVFSGSTGKIAGIVKDKNSGEPLIGVNVTVEGTTLGASTDVDGTFVILNIPPGVYTLVAQYIGFSNSKIENVKVNVDLTTELTIQMQEAALDLGETVTVVAQRDLVVKDLTASTATVDADRIQALPITEISEALELQAGYVDGHARGGRTGEIAYWIDGVPVTDAYDGGQVVEVNKDMVEQLQFISGAFNAEYGQAMSGIVNITTKEPTQRFGGNFTAYMGDYYSSHNDVFWNTNNFKPTNIYNFEGGIYGQIVPQKLSYFVNGRYIYFGGWLYGLRQFNPGNIAYTDPTTNNFITYRDPAVGKGDSSYVPMNWNRKVYYQGKLIYNITPMMKVFYNFIRDDVNFEEYDRNYKLNPDGNLNRFRTGYTHMLKLNHTLGSKTFYELGVSYFNKTYKQYVYANQQDPRYVHPKVNDNVQLYSFKTGGTNNQYFYRNTKTALLKFDLTSQVNKRHMVKTGLELRRYDVYFDDITLRPAGGDNLDFATDSPYMQPVVYPVNTPYHSQYRHNPVEFSAYIQDKMEFEDLIVNIGVRLDHFRPEGVVLADPTDPNIFNPLKPDHRYHDLNGNGMQDPGEPNTTLAERETYWYRDASNKTQVSPRLGISFPITETGIIHFSYGHFFQLPSFELLYQNPQFKLGSGTGNQGVIGNADMRPEQTISGEIGLQQQMGNDLALDVTAYFRDIRDLAGTRADQIDIFGGSATYSKLVNSDFGFVKGLIISLRNRYTQGFNYTLDYTFQIAKGTASDPNAAQQAYAAGNMPEVHMIPLNWDQRHTINATLNYNTRSWGASLIGTFGTGQPYTPRQSGDVSVLRQNSEVKPTSWNVDMRLYKDFHFFERKVTAFLRVLNLFDHLNEVNVFDDTGRAGFTTDLENKRKLNPPMPVNTLDQWFTDATHYSEPRRIEFGLMFDF